MPLPQIQKQQYSSCSYNLDNYILEVSDDGAITVDIAFPDHDGFTSKLCVAIAKKIMQDEDFQAELMDMIEEE